jgi:hypothetical protein
MTQVERGKEPLLRRDSPSTEKNEIRIDRYVCNKTFFPITKWCIPFL